MAESSDKLADALAEIPGVPPELVACARYGYYHDFQSPLAMPDVQLAADLGVMARSPGTPAAARPMYRALIARVKAGDFDATRAESDAWARSADGQVVFQSLGLSPGAPGDEEAVPAPS